MFICLVLQQSKQRLHVDVLSLYQSVHGELFAFVCWVEYNRISTYTFANCLVRYAELAYYITRIEYIIQCMMKVAMGFPSR